MFSRKLWCSLAGRRTRRHSLPLSLSFAICALVLISTLAAWPASSKLPPEPSQPLIAIADVHNAFDDFVSILRRTGLIDAQNHWSGGKATFVQTGDLLDRGPKPREVVDLMMALEKEAPQAGGRVVSLLGNHELMNIMGDLRYVTPGNYASFSDASSAERQKTAHNDFLEWRGKHASLLAELTTPMELTEAEWLARHPLGFVEHREAFGPKGKYGEWLRGHSAVAEINGAIFLHGGITPALSGTKIDAMNSRIRDEIKNFDSLKAFLEHEKLILPFFTLQEINAVLLAEVTLEAKSRSSGNGERQTKIQEFLKQGEWLSVRVDGPLWFRGYDQWSDADGAPQIAKVLDAYKASHAVVGHTVQKGGRIRPRFDNKIFLIDTGMLSSYYPGGRPSALAFCAPSKIVAVYLDQQTAFVESPSHAASPAPSDSAAAPPKSVASPEELCSATQLAP
jgi:hypothetical protein